MISKKYSSEKNRTKAVVICGPTGSGKSRLAMALGLKYGGSIISADSRQIYRRLDIGTAKPSREDREAIPHYMIDIADVSEDFTAARFAREARKNLELIASEKRIPLVVGGAGLYIAALAGGLFEGPGRDEGIRQQLELAAKSEGIHELHRRLEKVDPVEAATISPNDSIRIIRALEIYQQSGQPPSLLKEKGDYIVPDAEFAWIGLSPSRDRLYERIDGRVDKMIEDGLIDEIRGLMKDGMSGHIKRKNIVGYYEIIESLEVRGNMDDAIEAVKRHSRNYAKRQLTWFRNRANPVWLDPEDSDFYRKVNGLLDEYLKRT